MIFHDLNQWQLHVLLFVTGIQSVLALNDIEIRIILFASIPFIAGFLGWFTVILCSPIFKSKKETSVAHQRRYFQIQTPWQWQAGSDSISDNLF